MKTIFTIAAIFACSTAFAFIPGSKFIIEKLIQKNGSGIYQVEQDVVFTGANEILTLREVWQMDGEGQMKLTVRAPKEIADQLFLQNVYLGGQKWFKNGGSRTSTRISEDFFEKFFYIKSRDAFTNHMVNLRILSPNPPAIMAKAPKPPKKVEKKPTKGKKVADAKDAKDAKDKVERDEYIYNPEPNVRLSRIGGVVAYAFGTPAPVDGEPTSGVWIEQDLFHLRKIRLPSKVEVIAENFGSFARNINLPQQRTVRWNQKSVQINLVKVTGLPPASKSAFNANNIEGTGNRIGGIRDSDISQTVEEFYQRFR